MKIGRNIVIMLLFTFVFLGCRKEEEDIVADKYAPTDVILKLKDDYPIDKAFDFINSFNHDVEHMSSQMYVSDLPSDSLQYVVNYLNLKSYTSEKNGWAVNGRLEAGKIIVFARLYRMKNIAFQKDWLESIKLLKLKEVTDRKDIGTVIYFHVPAGKEKFWVNEFKKYEFVEWAELNYIVRFGHR